MCEFQIMSKKRIKNPFFILKIISQKLSVGLNKLYKNMMSVGLIPFMLFVIVNTFIV